MDDNSNRVMDLIVILFSFVSAVSIGITTKEITTWHLALVNAMTSGYLVGSMISYLRKV